MNDHHYAFAHWVVRDYVQHNPLEFIALWLRNWQGTPELRGHE